MTDRTKAPAIKPFEGVRLDFPDTRYLSNGIPIQIINQGSDEVNRLSLYVRGGIVDEDYPLQSMLTSAILVDGSSDYTSSQIAQCLDFNGAWKAVQSYDDWTEISFWSLNEHFDKTLDILSSCLKSPTFDADVFGLLQRRHARNSATQHKRGKYLASMALMNMLYGPNHPLSRDVTPDDIMKQTPSQARDFYLRFFKPCGMRIVLAGCVTDEMFSMTDAALGAMHMDGTVPSLYDWSAYRPPESSQLVIVDKPDAVQASIAMAIPAIKRQHPDYIKLRVLITLLGGYFGSRLMSNVREDKGYTYGISAMLAGRKQSGYIGISTECELVHTKPLIDEVKHDMRRLREELVSEAELGIVRQNMISDLVKTLDTPFNVATYVASTITFGVYPEYFNEQVEQIMAITPVDVQLMAQRYLNDDKLLTAIAAPKDSINLE